MKSKRKISFKSKLVTLLSLLCVTLISSVGLASFLLPGNIYQDYQLSGDVNLLYSNTLSQSVTFKSAAISKLEYSSTGFVNPLESEKQFSKEYMIFNVNLTIETYLTIDANLKIQFSQNAGDVNLLNFYASDYILTSNNKKVRYTSYIDNVYEYETTSTDFGFLNEGTNAKTITFSVHFIAIDESTISNFETSIFEAIVNSVNKPKFTINLEIY